MSCPLSSGIHWPINFTKKLRFLDIFNKKSDKFFWDPSLHFSFAFFCCWKYPETKFFLVKLIGQWIPDGEGRRIARNIHKIIFSFSKVGTRDTWHVTNYTWHMTGWGMWTFCQNFSSLTVTVWQWRCFEEVGQICPPPPPPRSLMYF